MKYFILILATLLSSCVTRERCERKFPGGSAVTTEVNTVTVIRDTVVYVEIPGDTVFESVPVVEGEVSKLHTPLAFSFAWVDGGKLNHRLEQKDTVVGSIVKGGLRTTIQESEQTDIKYINNLTGWQWFQVYFGRVFIGLVVVVIAWRVILFKRA